MIRSFDCGEYYSTCQHIFKRRCNQDAEIVKMLQNYLPSQVTTSGALIENDSEFRILGIGSGTGEMDMKIVDMVAEELKRNNVKEYQNMKIYARAIEPYAASCQQFNDAAGLGNLSVKYDVRAQTFEEYTQNKEAKAFDIIHFIHSTYYFDAESAILHCLEKQMKADGFLICVFTDHGIITDIQNEIAKAKQAEPTKLHGDSQTTKLLKSIEKSGWKYEIIRQEYPVDVTGIIDSGGLITHEGSMLLDFLTHQADFQNAEPQLVERVLELLRNKSTEKNGRRMSSKTDTLLVVYK